MVTLVLFSSSEVNASVYKLYFSGSSVTSFQHFSTYNGYAGLRVDGYGEAGTYLYPIYTTVLVSSATFQVCYWNGSIQDEVYKVQYPERSTFNKGSTQGRVGDLRGRQDSLLQSETDCRHRHGAHLPILQGKVAVLQGCQQVPHW